METHIAYACAIETESFSIRRWIRKICINEIYISSISSLSADFFFLSSFSSRFSPFPFSLSFASVNQCSAFTQCSDSWIRANESIFFLSLVRDWKAPVNKSHNWRNSMFEKLFSHRFVHNIIVLAIVRWQKCWKCGRFTHTHTHRMLGTNPISLLNACHCYQFTFIVTPNKHTPITAKRRSIHTHT